MEKVKLTVPVPVFMDIMDDTMRFGFPFRNGKSGINAFLNAVFVNLDTYHAEQANALIELFDKGGSFASLRKMSFDEKKELAYASISSLSKFSMPWYPPYRQVMKEIMFYPLESKQGALNRIFGLHEGKKGNKNVFYTTAMRELLKEYFSYHRIVRERIAKRDVIDAFERGIRENRIVRLRQCGIITFDVCPLRVRESHDNTYIYLVAMQKNGKDYEKCTFRLSWIEKVEVTNEPFDPRIKYPEEKFGFRIDEGETYDSEIGCSVYVKDGFKSPVFTDKEERPPILWASLKPQAPFSIWCFCEEESQLAKYLLRFGGVIEVLDNKNVDDRLISSYKEYMNCEVRPIDIDSQPNHYQIEVLTEYDSFFCYMALWNLYSQRAKDNGSKYGGDDGFALFRKGSEDGLRWAALLHRPDQGKSGKPIGLISFFFDEESKIATIRDMWLFHRYQEPTLKEIFLARLEDLKQKLQAKDLDFTHFAGGESLD